jgi:hypothetical protein
MPQEQSDDGFLSPDKRTKLICRVLILVVELAMEMRKESPSIKGSISESYGHPHEHVITLGVLYSTTVTICMGNTIGSSFRLLCACLLN